MLRMRGILYAFIPYLMVIVGLISLFISVFHLSAEGQPLLQKFLLAVSTSILIGGVFSATLKTFQYMGVFREEIAKVLVEGDYLKNRVFAERAWLNSTKSIVENSFPRIDSDAYSEYLAEYIPAVSDYYFENLKRTVVLTWTDDSRTKIKMRETLEVQVVPSTEAKNINYQFELEGHPDTQVSITEFSVNGKNYADDQSVMQTTTSETSILCRFQLNLSGDKQHSVIRKITRIVDPSLDPVAKVVSLRFVDKLKLAIENKAKGLKLVFASLGTQRKFQDIFGADRLSDDILKEYDGILFPNQGYAIAFFIDEEC